MTDFEEKKRVSKEIEEELLSLHPDCCVEFSDEECVLVNNLGEEMSLYEFSPSSPTRILLETLEGLWLSEDYISTSGGGI